MADFNARINVEVAVQKALRGSSQVEKAIGRIQDTAVDIKVKGSKDIKEAGRALQRFGTISKGLVAAGGLGTLATILKDFEKVKFIGPSLKAALGPIDGVTQAIGNFTEAAIQAAASAPGLAAAITATTVAAVAFAPQVREAAGALLGISKRAAEAGFGLRALGGLFTQAEVDAESAAKALEVYRARLFEINETVEVLSRRQSKLRATLNQFNSSSDTAAKIAGKLVDVTRRLNIEQERQNDLLREARGLSQSRLEESKAVNSLATSKRAEEFRKQQKADIDAVQRSLQKLAETQAKANNALLDERAQTVYDRRLANYQQEQKELEESLRLTRQLNEERRRGITRIQGPSPQQTGVVAGPRENIFSRVERDANVARRATQELIALEQRYAKTKRDTATASKLQLTALTKLGTVAAANYKIEVQALQTQFDKLQAFKQEIALAREAQRVEKARRRGQLGQDVLLGAGFPLLFGGGAGSVLGGLGGSLAGGGNGGFGAQIIGSAIGQIVDQITQAAVELGQALNPLTADFDTIATAAGTTGTELGALLQELNNTDAAAAALQLATEKLALEIGNDGVEALRNFGEASTRLQNEVTKLQTQFLAFAATLAGPVTEALANAFERTNLVNAANRFLSEGGPEAERIRAAGQRSQQENPGDLQAQINAELEVTKQILAEQTSELTEQARLRLEGIQLAEEDERIEKELLDALKERARVQAQIERDAEKAARKKEKAAREAQRAAEKEAQVQRSVAQLNVQAFELETKLAGLGQTKSDQLALEALRMTQLMELRRQAIQLSTEDDRIKQARLALLTVEEEILTRQNQLAQERLRIEENLQFLQGQQRVQGIQRDLNQELQGIQIPSGNRDADQRDALSLKQAQRYENTLTNINDQLAQQKLLEASSDEEISRQATAKIAVLEKEKQTYQEMLPAIAAAEQQQLKFNQAYEKIKPVADAVTGSLINGIRGVIEGTKTAEEAFKDFLNTIVDLLLKSAAEQIATYIAIGLARQFAGLGGGTNSGGEATKISSASTSSLSAGFAEAGGRTMANMPYVVGEKGAELFIPGKTGTVIPADVFEATRQAVKGNGPEGGNSDAFAQNSVALGNSTTISKEKELVREMDMRNNEPIEVRYDSTVINNVSYVSEDEFQKGLKAAVAQSKSAVYSDLKNKPRARAGIGLR